VSTKIIKIIFFIIATIKYILINNNKFNLLSDLVPLIGPRRLISIVKT